MKNVVRFALVAAVLTVCVWTGGKLVAALENSVSERYDTIEGYERATNDANRN